MEKHYTDQGTTLPYHVADKDNKHWTYEPHVAEKIFNLMLDEAGVKVHLEETLDKAETTERTIVAVRTRSGKRFAGKVFIDASYEGDLMAAAGVGYRVGREGRDEFHESLAGARYPKDAVTVSTMDDTSKPLALLTTAAKSPEGQGDKLIMTYSFRFCFSRDPANQVPFTKPANYDPQHYELVRRYLLAYPKTDRLIDLYPIPGNKLDGNNGIALQLSTGLVGENADYPDANATRRQEMWEAHRSYAEGLFYFMKTDPCVPAHMRETINKIGYAKDEFQKFDHFPPVLYVREARRMEGAYFLTEADILININKPDSIGVGSFPIDSHDCRRIALDSNTFINDGTIFPVHVRGRDIGQPHQLPYRTITPKPEQCTNLLVPVCLSSSHVAFSSVRVEPTWIVLGQSSGVAAAVAVEKSLPVQSISYSELAARLKKQKQILEIP